MSGHRSPSVRIVSNQCHSASCIAPCARFWPKPRAQPAVAGKQIAPRAVLGEQEERDLPDERYHLGSGVAVLDGKTGEHQDKVHDADVAGQKGDSDQLTQQFF